MYLQTSGEQDNFMTDALRLSVASRLTLAIRGNIFFRLTVGARRYMLGRFIRGVKQTLVIAQSFIAQS